ncbi:MAG: orotidine-5'-phosphate decarboxylase [Deltaproteobacteria bacterium]|nr:MAG: orotidine-5'-phosphate decarboxylase [Deltaproteobacteria bacterium]
MSFDPGTRLIVALDVPDAAAAVALAERVRGAAALVKVGLELFCTEGPQVVRRLVAAGHRVMLDLKLHDIPATVARAAERVAALGADLLTVHAAGGRAMLEAAVRAAAPVRVLAVTVLTSLGEDDLDAIGAVGPVASLVDRRARLAAACGCAGIVASPVEARAVRGRVPRDFLIVTPGVRPAGADAGDQKRVATPAAAVAAGADLVVVGRPIRDAADPAAAARAIADELARAPERR